MGMQATWRSTATTSFLLPSGRCGKNSAMCLNTSVPPAKQNEKWKSKQF
jgi:hypothetical protein